MALTIYTKCTVHRTLGIVVDYAIAIVVFAVALLDVSSRVDRNALGRIPVGIYTTSLPQFAFSRKPRLAIDFFIDVAVAIVVLTVADFIGGQDFSVAKIRQRTLDAFQCSLAAFTYAARSFWTGVARFCFPGRALATLVGVTVAIVVFSVTNLFAWSDGPLAIAQLAVNAGPVSYTHLRAHETLR